VRIYSSFVLALAISLSCIVISTPSFAKMTCSISNDFFNTTPVGDEKCYPGKQNSPTGDMEWEIRTFQKGDIWAISALTILEWSGDFVLNHPKSIKDAFEEITWVKNKSPKFQKMAKRTVKTNVFQKFTKVYSTSLDSWASDCFAFISFKGAAGDDRPVGAFRAIVCNKAGTGISDKLMDEISMRFNVNNRLHNAGKFKYWKYEANKEKKTKQGSASANKVSNAPTPASPTSTSKLDKAKLTCTELGFTLGTEKHGECVLKVMDN
jgi:hypothetical protein